MAGNYAAVHDAASGFTVLPEAHELRLAAVQALPWLALKLAGGGESPRHALGLVAMFQGQLPGNAVVADGGASAMRHEVADSVLDHRAP